MTLSVVGHPILIISYNAEIRLTLSENLQRNNVLGIPCESFAQAEDIAREGVYNGILVDLQSIVKAKGDEKIVACSLTVFIRHCGCGRLVRCWCRWPCRAMPGRTTVSAIFLQRAAPPLLRED